MPDVHDDGRYEWLAELDTDWCIASGPLWRGHRIHYRELGSRGRWRSFLLAVDGDTTPDSATIVHAIDEHVSVSPFPR